MPTFFLASDGETMLICQSYLFTYPLFEFALVFSEVRAHLSVPVFWLRRGGGGRAGNDEKS